MQSIKFCSIITDANIPKSSRQFLEVINEYLFRLLRKNRQRKRLNQCSNARSNSVLKSNELFVFDSTVFRLKCAEIGINSPAGVFIAQHSIDARTASVSETHK